jgi:release factor glutamine methyltransferase
VTTIKGALAEGASKLGDRDPENRRAARILLAHTLSATQEHILSRPGDPITETQYAAFIELISRRAHGEPLQHITGHQEFYGLDFIVNADVLIPRPETEFLVEEVLKLGTLPGLGSEEQARLLPEPEPEPEPDPGRQSPGPLIVDVGTGSGCIAIALAVSLPSAAIVAIDISSPALDVARRNAEQHGVMDRIQFLLGDLLGPLQQGRFEGRVDIIASNPPYVSTSRPDLVQKEVKDFEPAIALYGGPDGLSFYRRLLVDAPRFLKPDGYLVCEIGYTQVDEVRRVADAAGWDFVNLAEDLQGIPRTLTVRRKRWISS